MAMSQQHAPPVNKYTGSYTEDADGDGVRMNAFDHEDVDISFDPLSANRRFSGTADLAVLGVHYVTCMDCGRRISTLGGGEKHAARTTLTMASS